MIDNELCKEVTLKIAQVLSNEIEDWAEKENFTNLVFILSGMLSSCALFLFTEDASTEIKENFIDDINIIAKKMLNNFDTEILKNIKNNT